MALPVFTAGYEPSPEDLITLQPVFAYKTAPESVTSNVTPQNDDHLLVAGLANAVYEVLLSIDVTGAGSATLGDIVLQFTFPASGSGQSLTLGYHGLKSAVAYGVATEGSLNTVAFRNTTSPSTAAGFGTPSTNYSRIIASGLWIVGTVAGALQLQWAQRVSTATATTLRDGSFLRLTRVG